jgi:hypothetical protein
LLKLEEAHLGTDVRCPACQQIFAAEAAAEEREAIQEQPIRPAPRRERPIERDYAEEERRWDDDDFRSGEPHRGGTVLTMGILALVFALCCPLVCWVLGGIGLSMANTDLDKMARHKMDRSGQGSTQTGKVLAIVGLVLGSINAVLGVILRAKGVMKF